MVTLLKNLKWRERQSDFSLDEQRVLLFLSNKDWEWRTFDSLRVGARLSRDELGLILKDLIIRGLVTGSVEPHDWEPVFGLVERVGPGGYAQRLEREKRASGV
ncbi:MAG: hypothetical protein OXC95_10670 [Dehalococcoidia bacterium]|nr:hypothetical protein [Dehalococcoidia bacterium]